MKALQKLLLVSTIAATSVLSSSAIQLEFFAQDRGLGESTPLTSWTNSSAAETNFLSYLVGTGTETFESKTTGAAAGTLTFPGAGLATMTGDATVRNGANGFGRYPISGSKWVETSTSLAINFSQAVAAFGFYGVDVGDFGGNLKLSFLDGTTKTVTLNTAGMPGGSVMFYGYINNENPFTSIQFGNSMAGTDFFAFDNMTIGSVEQVKPVPDGGVTVGLLGLALLGIAFVRRSLFA